MKRLFCLLMLVATGGLLANGKIITGVNEDGDETTCMDGKPGVDGCRGVMIITDVNEDGDKTTCMGGEGCRKVERKVEDQGSRTVKSK